MAKYVIELNYMAAITLEVEANEEGEALQKARDLAEQAPMSSFSIIEEEASRIINVQNR